MRIAQFHGVTASPMLSAIKPHVGRGTSAACRSAVMAFFLAGCGANLPIETGSQALATSNPSDAAAYVLTAQEQAMSCRNLTGRMQVMILEMRGPPPAASAISFGSALQNSFAALLPGAAAAPDPATQYAADRRRLAAYNNHLQTSGCASFDLTAALAQSDSRVTPVPVASAANKTVRGSTDPQ
jgi:hypothetical protein